jgi:CheY-like chemotaxis protein
MTGTSVTAKTVLIADDTAFVRDRFKTALEDAGHRPILARSAVELLAKVRADLDRIDLIALDLRLPNAPGVDLVRAIRKIDGGRLPILVFSGTIVSADEVRELSSLGVVGYVNEYSAVQHILPSLAPHLFPDSFNRRRQPARRPGHPGRVPVRKHDRHRADVEPQSRRHRHPHDQPARARRRRACPLPPAGGPPRGGRRVARRVE